MTIWLVLICRNCNRFFLFAFHLSLLYVSNIRVFFTQKNRANESFRQFLVARTEHLGGKSLHDLYGFEIDDFEKTTVVKIEEDTNQLLVSKAQHAKNFIIEFKEY